MPEESGLKLEKTWHVRPGREPGEVWLGAAPGALLRSTDGGKTFESVASLTQHETRDRWEPGAGGMCCHSIQLDAEDPNRMYVAISAAGSFRSDDGAETWTPINKNVAADFIPRSTRKSASASTSCSRTRRRPSGSGSRTTAASTARTIAATTGSGSTATACPAASASRSCFTHATRTRPG